MLLGQFVVGQIDGGETMAHEVAFDLVGLVALADGDADEHMGHCGIRDAVVELRHAARADQGAEALEGAALLRNRHGEQGLALFAELRPLCHEAQAVEVHVGAAGDGDESLPFELVFGRVLLGAGHAQGAGRLEDAARILEHILDRCADGVGIDHDEVVDQGAHEAKCFNAHQLDGRAVGEQAHVLQRHATPSAHRAQHGVGVFGLHADHFDLGAHCLDVSGDAGDEAAAADGHEDGIDRPLVLTQDFHRHRALTGDDMRVVEGMDESQAAFGLERLGVAVSVGVAVTVQHHLAAEGAHGVDLEFGCGDRHHDGGVAAELLGRQRHALRVVAGGGADHTAGQLLGAQVHHLVISAAQLEAEHRLLVFALQKDLIAEPARQRARKLEWRLDGHVVHPRC